MEAVKYRANPVIVEAHVIMFVGIEMPDGGVGCTLHNGSTVVASAEMLARMTPRPGDYLVVQEDGYVYLNPKSVFERKYSPLSVSAYGPFSFGDAIGLLKSGAKVSRMGWNGKSMWLALQVPDAHSKMTLPYIYMKTAQGDLVPWLASQTDVLSNDWQVAAE